MTRRTIESLLISVKGSWVALEESVPDEHNQSDIIVTVKERNVRDASVTVIPYRRIKHLRKWLDELERAQSDGPH